MNSIFCIFFSKNRFYLEDLIEKLRHCFLSRYIKFSTDKIQYYKDRKLYYIKIDSKDNGYDLAYTALYSYINKYEDLLKESRNNCFYYIIAYTDDITLNTDPTGKFFNVKYIFEYNSKSCRSRYYRDDNLDNLKQCFQEICEEYNVAYDKRRLRYIRSVDKLTSYASDYNIYLTKVFTNYKILSNETIIFYNDNGNTYKESRLSLIDRRQQ